MKLPLLKSRSDIQIHKTLNSRKLIKRLKHITNITKVINMLNYFHLKQTLVKERKEAGLKKYSAAVHKFLEELAKIGTYI